MTAFDQSTNFNPIPAVNPASVSSDTTTAGAIIDTQGYGSLTFIVQTGARTAGTVTPLIEESDDSGLSGSNAVADADLIGLEASAALAAANKTSKIGYVGKKRYVRCSLVTTGSTNAFIIGALALLGDPKTAPKSDQTP